MMIFKIFRSLHNYLSFHTLFISESNICMFYSTINIQQNLSKPSPILFLHIFWNFSSDLNILKFYSAETLIKIFIKNYGAKSWSKLCREKRFRKSSQQRRKKVESIVGSPPPQFFMGKKTGEMGKIEKYL